MTAFIKVRAAGAGRPFHQKQALAIQMIKREIAGRYRGSALGILWSLLTPLFMLGVYTFVFSMVFQTHWATDEHSSTAVFAVILFAGLIIFQLFAEVLNRAPTLILSNVNYVKKVVFPLEILPVIALGSALFHAAVSFVVLLGFILIVMGTIPLTALLLPVVLAPFLLLILGLGWFFSSLGVYLRDISQFLGTTITALMFLSPIFFPSSALPDWIRPYLFLNPLALPIEQIREVVIWGRMPDFVGLSVYAVIAIIVAGLGYMWFQKTRKGFADVL